MTGALHSSDSIQHMDEEACMLGRTCKDCDVLGTGDLHSLQVIAIFPLQGFLSCLVTLLTLIACIRIVLQGLARICLPCHALDECLCHPLASLPKEI